MCQLIKHARGEETRKGPVKAHGEVVLAAGDAASGGGEQASALPDRWPVGDRSEAEGRLRDSCWYVDFDFFNFRRNSIYQVNT